MGQLDGRIALVTGAGEGIGRATAAKLAEAGAKVAVTDINRSAADGSAEAISAAAGQAMALEHDVCDEARWIEVVARVEETWGGLDILVNNAGIAIVGHTLDMSLEDWRRQTAVNIDGVFLGVKHGIPAMRRGGRGGSVINLSSVAGLEGSAMLTGNCATKGAVRLFTKAVALECAQDGDGVRVNSVHPGIIETRIWAKMTGGDNALNPVAIGKIAVPLGQSAGPEVVADGILFLASDAARYITGTELVIDGGLTAGRSGSLRERGAG